MRMYMLASWVVATNVSWAAPLHWLATHLSCCLMSHQLEWTLKPSGSCGQWSLISVLCASSRPWYWQRTRWRKLRLFAQRWELWSMANSSVLGQRNTLRTSMQMVSTLILRSVIWLNKRWMITFRSLIWVRVLPATLLWMRLSLKMWCRDLAWIKCGSSTLVGRTDSPRYWGRRRPSCCRMCWDGLTLSTVVWNLWSNWTRSLVSVRWWSTSQIGLIWRWPAIRTLLGLCSGWWSSSKKSSQSVSTRPPKPLSSKSSICLPNKKVLRTDTKVLRPTTTKSD